MSTDLVRKTSVVALALGLGAVALPPTHAAEVTPSHPLNIREEYSLKPSAQCEEVGQGKTVHTKSTARHVGNPGNRVYGQSGATITVKESQTWTTTGSISGSISSEAGALFAAVEAEVGFEVSVSKAVTQGSSYAWMVPEDQERGWVELGNNGFDVKWAEGYVKAPSTWVETDSGSAVLVTDQKSYIHS